MTKILIFGRDGQLGRELNNLLSPRFEVSAISAAQADLSQPQQIVAAIREHAPRLIVNAAAYTAVDKAEEERDAAFAINALAPGVMAQEAYRSGAGLVHFSTDFVFDGVQTRPYRETDETKPVNVYGESKLAGEHAVLGSPAAAIVFRTSWLYGLRGHNFLLTMLKLLRSRDELSVVDDQIGTPTSVHELAQQVVDAVTGFAGSPTEFCLSHRGIFHLSCEGAASWYQFASAIRDFHAQQGVPMAVLRPITSDQYPTAARRPPYSVLDKSKFSSTFGAEIRDWNSALNLVLTRFRGP